MLSIQVPAEVTAKLDAFTTALAGMRELNLDRLAPPVRLHVLEQLETSRRRQVALSHDVIGGLAREDPAELGGLAYQVIADWLRISYTEARRRIHDVTQLSPRLTLTGQQLPPELPATAQAWRQGLLDAQHLKVIQTFVHDLPRDTPIAVVEHAENLLAQQATQLRPDQLHKAANRAAVLINPDGNFSDADRARQRGFTWSPQRADGMSLGKLTATPELRTNLEAWCARFAAPGMCSPDDQIACVNGDPSQQAARTDTRSPAQRQHDALNALVRGQLGDPTLGTHNGLPVTVIASTTLQELTTGAGHAVTGGGTVLPIPDLIRMARHAYHYLAVFDHHSTRPLYLGRTRRIASPRSTRGPLRQRSRLHPPRLRRPRLLERSPPHPRLGHRRHHRHRQTHLRLPQQSQTHRQRLENKKTPQRPNRMDPPTPPRPRPTPHQQLPPPRTNAARRERR
jgi:Domain of unknown function (DUF222)